MSYVAVYYDEKTSQFPFKFLVALKFLPHTVKVLPLQRQTRLGTVPIRRSVGDI